DYDNNDDEDILNNNDFEFLYEEDCVDEDSGESKPDENGLPIDYKNAQHQIF
ncbi:unnamed protein product, partial [Rotaria sp. Silwood1]